MIYYSHYIAYTFGSHDYVCKKKQKIKNGKSVDLNGFLYLQCLWLQYNNTRYKKGEA